MEIKHRCDIQSLTIILRISFIQSAGIIIKINHVASKLSQSDALNTCITATDIQAVDMPLANKFKNASPFNSVKTLGRDGNRSGVGQYLYLPCS